MLSAIPALLTDMAAIVGAFTVIVGGLVMLIKLPPTRFVVQRLLVMPLEEWFRGQVSNATTDIREMADETTHMVSYHLGSNDTTMPVHERLSRIESFHGLVPVKQNPKPQQ